jgi:hypothetical protein
MDLPVEDELKHYVQKNPHGEQRVDGPKSVFSGSFRVSLPFCSETMIHDPFHNILEALFINALRQMHPGHPYLLQCG